jgi:hypothetical protein
MEIRYAHSTEGIDWDAVAQLFQQVGWGVRAPEALEQAFRQSSHVRFAFADQQDGYFFMTLTSAVGKEGFYLKQGWLPQKTAFIWPRSEYQRQDHATS